MKLEIPDQLKSDLPQSTWGKILSATPVVMAVVATMLAGLASSEMTRAQYDRSLAAQQQSKAGDQWSFFQAKRLRGALQRNTIDILQSTAVVRPLQEGALRAASADLAALLETPTGRDTLSLLQKGEVPRIGPPPTVDEKIKLAQAAVEDLKPEEEVSEILSKVKDEELTKALDNARDYAKALDAATSPVNQVIDQLERGMGQLAASGKGEESPARDFTAARLRYTAQRYDAEARANQAIASLYELQVRKSNISAQRHHTRSQRFFYGMLGAQAGVIIATFAMAARKRNLLWSLAAAAGLIAIAFAVYVYLYV